jgi:hypothetical protein
MVRKTELKLRISQEKDMSKDGYLAWSPHARLKLHKKTYSWIMRIDVPVQEIQNEKALEIFALKNLWTGKFLVFGYSHGKTPTHVKPVLLCKLNVRINNEGAGDCRVSHTRRLSRYWFWKK